jgi:regulator of protease activity HflC (stomatin/prohibitin superfamily)
MRAYTRTHSTPCANLSSGAAQAKTRAQLDAAKAELEAEGAAHRRSRGELEAALLQAAAMQKAPHPSSSFPAHPPLRFKPYRTDVKRQRATYGPASVSEGLALC